MNLRPQKAGPPPPPPPVVPLGATVVWGALGAPPPGEVLALDEPQAAAVKATARSSDALNALRCFMKIDLRSDPE